VDTAEEILAEAGGQPTELFLVIGADLVPELDSWHRSEDLRRLVTLAVVSRPTGPPPAISPGWRTEWVDGPQVAVSSSEVRGLLGEGHSVEGMVPERIIRCIERRDLYAGP
jgi:nicotinate-nucleotide adenylyltransferase